MSPKHSTPSVAAIKSKAACKASRFPCTSETIAYLTRPLSRERSRESGRVRYAIVSDVHGNLEALQAAFDLIAATDGVLCLGDIVGYGPNPNECVEMIRSRATATVLGNHDVAAIDNFGLSYFNPTAREAIRWTQAVLTTENADWLN